MKHLYLVRHGQSTANASQTVAGVSDAPLSELGFTQARLAGQNFKRFFTIDRIVVSPLTRARQTAEAIAAEIGIPADAITILPDLHERDLGSLEGHPKSDIPNQYTANIEDIEGMPGQEPIQAFHDRVAQAYQAIQAMPEDHILVVAHNGSGRMLKTIIEGLAPTAMYQQPRLENCVMCRLR